MTDDKPNAWPAGYFASDFDSEEQKLALRKLTASVLAYVPARDSVTVQTLLHTYHAKWISETRDSNPPALSKPTASEFDEDALLSIAHAIYKSDRFYLAKNGIGLFSCGFIKGFEYAQSCTTQAQAEINRLTYELDKSRESQVKPKSEAEAAWQIAVEQAESNPDNMDLFHNEETCFKAGFKSGQQSKAVKALRDAVSAYREYFEAIASGEYETNRRPSPLRDFEMVLQLKATEAIAAYAKEFEGK